MKIFGSDALLKATHTAGLLREVKLASDENFPKVTYRYVFENEDHTHSPVPLAAFAARSCLADGPCIVNIGATKIWPSSCDEFLIAAVLTQMFGVNASMFGDSSVIHVEKDECSELTTIFHMAMIFGWDIDCFCKATFLQFEIDHDGIIAFYFAEDDPAFGETFFSATHRRLERYI